MGLGKEYIKQLNKEELAEQTRLVKVRKKKDTLLFEPKKRKALVEAFATGAQLTTRKPKFKKYADRLEAIDARAKGTPMKGYAKELDTTFTQALSSKEYKGIPAEKILPHISKRLLEIPRGKKGLSRRQESYIYKMREDTRAGNLFDLFGEDSSVKAPPGYQEFRKRVAEQKVESHYTHPLTSAVLGGGFAAAAHGVKRFLFRKAPQKLAAMPGIYPKVAGAALAAVPLFFAGDVAKNVMHKTDYAKAREGTWEKVIADLGLDIITMAGASKIGLKTVTKLAEKSAVVRTLEQKFISSGGKAKETVDLIKAKDDVKPVQFKLNKNLKKTEVKKDLFDLIVSKEIAAPTTLKGARPKLTFDKQGVVERPGMPGISKPPRVGTVESKEAFTPFELRKKTVAKITKREKASIVSEPVETEIWKPTKVAPKKGEKFSFPGVSKKPGISKRYPTSVEVKDKIKRFAPASKVVEKTSQGSIIQVTPRVKVLVREIPSTVSGKITKAKSGRPFNSLKNVRPLTKIQGEVWEDTIKKGNEVKSDFVKLSDEATDEALKRSKEVGIKEAVNEATEADSLIVSQGTKKYSAKEQTAELVKTNAANTVAKKNLTKAIKPEKIVTKEEKTTFKRRLEKLKETKDKKTKLTELVKEQEKDLLDSSVELNKITSLPEEEAFTQGKKDVLDMFKGIAGAGLATVLSLSLLFPDEADASVASTIANTVTSKTGMKYLAKGFKNLKGAELETTKLNILADSVQVGLSGVPVGTSTIFKSPMKSTALNVAEMAANELGNIGKAVRGKTVLPNFIANKMTVGATGELRYGNFSPAIEIAHGQTATNWNIPQALEVVRNIAKKVPGLIERNSQKEIITAMEPLTKQYNADIVTYGTVKYKIKQLNKSYNKLIAGTTKLKGKRKLAQENSIVRIENKILNLEKAEIAMRPRYQRFLKEYDSTIKNLAGEHSSTRIALATEDTAEFASYPWLKGMLTREEKVAVAYYKKFYEDYATRVLEVGGKTISERPFIHHALPPSWLEKGNETILKNLDIEIDSAIPFSKFFRRHEYSRMMVPDIIYNTTRYIPDAEKRIQWMSFWKKGQKENPNTWFKHSKSARVLNDPNLSNFWAEIKGAAKPQPNTAGNIWANRYSAFEVARLIALNPSTAVKHLFKAVGQVSALGVKEYATHFAPAMKLAARNKLESIEGRRLLSKFGIKNTRTKNNLLNDLAASQTHQGTMLNVLGDLEMREFAGKNLGARWDKMMQKVNIYGSIPIRMVEFMDRTHTFLAAFDMAAKKGMTAQQAAYGFYSTTLKNNFLNQSLNPSWMRNPKIRATILFQQTPYKILERRVVTALRFGKTLKLGKEVLNEQGLKQTLKDLLGLRKYIIEGSDEFKKNLIGDALRSERDFYGTTITKQLMTEVLFAGALIMGGKKMLDTDLTSHVSHLPIIGLHGSEPTIAVNPILKSFLYTISKKTYEEEHAFFISDFLKNYLGSTQYMPSVMNKMLKLSENDIPDVYQDSKLKYLFAFPAFED